MLFDAIGSRWYAYVEAKTDLISLGTARTSFAIDRSGRERNVKVMANDANEAFANVCLQSILEVQLPPIPEDVANPLPPDALATDTSLTTLTPRSPPPH